jgi:hypothetical protein
MHFICVRQVSVDQPDMKLAESGSIYPTRPPRVLTFRFLQTSQGLLDATRLFLGTLDSHTALVSCSCEPGTGLPGA